MPVINKKISQQTPVVVSISAREPIITKLDQQSIDSRPMCSEKTETEMNTSVREFRFDAVKFKQYLEKQLIDTMHLIQYIFPPI